MRSFTSSRLAFAVLLFVLFYSCGKRKDNNFAIESVNNTEIDSILEAISTPQNIQMSSTIGILPDGTIKKMWQDIFKSCMENDQIKNPIYFGISNNIDIGSILTLDKKDLIWDISKVFTLEERNKFITAGVPQNCELNAQIDFNYNSVFRLNYDTTKLDLELSNFIHRYRNINITQAIWHIDKLNSGILLKMLENPDYDSDIFRFSEQIEEKNAYIITEVVKIDQFTAEISSYNNITDSLSIALNDGMLKNIPWSNCNIMVSFVDSATIKLQSMGSFIVMAQIRKLKHMSQ